MGSPSPDILRFEDVELDLRAYTLRRQGRLVRLPRQPMELLTLLVERRGTLVTREQIAAHLWQEDVFVDVDAGIHTAMLKIRRALRDSSHASRFIETVTGKGYRFIADVSTPAAGAYPPALRHNLPANFTSFVGRQNELDEVRTLLDDARLVSLTGPGGVGKTRLAVHVGEAVVDRFANGVWLVDLGSLSDEMLVPQSVAEVLGIRPAAHQSIADGLVHHLRSRELLIVLDTCEHVIAACAELVERLLHAASQLRVLATTREPLGIPGEALYRVPSLEIPAADTVQAGTLQQFAATRLFLDRAEARTPGFVVSEQLADSVFRICRRLDGIPLAIELAAARVSVFSLDQIAERLDDRFRLLTGGARTAVPRQRTLEAAVGWSYQLLSPAERHLLASLAVFPGSFGVAAIEHICGPECGITSDPLTLLAALVDKSLLTRDGEYEGESRYRLLETVRQYARERLTESERSSGLRDRHLAYFHQKYRGATAVLRGANQLRCLNQLRLDQEDIRSALEWGLAGKEHVAAELAASLFWFWTKHAIFDEGRAWLERAMTISPSDPTRARLLIGLAHMHYFQGRLRETEAAAEAALALGHEADDAWVLNFALFFKALTQFEQGAYDAAEVYAVQARAAADRSEERVQHGGPLMVIANIALMRGDHQAARQWYTESIAVHRTAGDLWGLSILLSADAGLRVIAGDFVAARRHATEALELSQLLDDSRGTAWALEVFAGMLAADGDRDGAARVWGAADALLDSVGGSLVPTIGWIRDRYVESTRLRMGPSFEESRLLGRSLSRAQAAAFAKTRAAHGDAMGEGVANRDRPADRGDVRILSVDG